VKAVFVGAGSLRVLGIVRGAFAERGIFEGGEICLHDVDADRAQAMHAMIAKSPEYSRVSCKLTCENNLAKALDGADMVGVILMAGSQKTFQMGADACLGRGFIPSDNVSPNGAFLAIKGAPILMNIAKKMARYCPNAWLVDFANPIAVLSGMINNHTKIKSLGICAGYTNHQWDLSRIFGKDEQGTEFDVETAGINHLSFIVKGTASGRNLFDALDEHLSKGWRMPRMQSHWSPAFKKSIPRGIRTLLKFYRERRILIFSTEGDGMMHLGYDAALADCLKDFKPLSPRQLNGKLRAAAKARQNMDKNFRSFLRRELDRNFWENAWRKPGMDWALRQDRDIFVDVLRGLSGVKKMKVVTSRPNRGAVEGFSDRTVLEYSQIIERGSVRSAGKYKVPENVRQITTDLATHQTKLADALAENDPRLLADALLSYPVRPFSREARMLYKDLAAINRDEIPRPLRRVVNYL
jgi:6-phospho-beta-glucosidase